MRHQINTLEIVTIKYYYKNIGSMFINCRLWVRRKIYWKWAQLFYMLILNPIIGFSLRWALTT